MLVAALKSGPKSPPNSVCQQHVVLHINITACHWLHTSVTRQCSTPGKIFVEVEVRNFNVMRVSIPDGTTGGMVCSLTKLCTHWTAWPIFYFCSKKWVCMYGGWGYYNICIKCSVIDSQERISRPRSTCEKLKRPLTTNHPQSRIEPNIDKYSYTYI